MVTFAKNNNSSQNIEYLIGKAEHLGFPNGQFDMVLFTLSLHHVPIEEMHNAINEVIRVTKKGGILYFRFVLVGSSNKFILLNTIMN